MGDDTAKKATYGLSNGLPEPDQHSFRPQILRITDPGFQQVVDSQRPVLHNELPSQLKNLFKIRNPQQNYSEAQLEELFAEWRKTHDEEAYGVYVYYPWNNRLVHLLDEEEFTELRTSRNKYKITEAEQKELARKKVGVIGLSVGQSVALTMALERTCGTLRLADHDHLELSNLNRLRSGVHNLGLPKTIIAAREIAEIDPYLKVELFHEGVTQENIDEFVQGEGKLDLLIEECDSLPIKIMARKKARDLNIPVVMDTSDRGMLDIERFDEEPSRELFHNLIPNLDKLDLDKLGEAERINILLKLVGGMSISSRLKASLVELNQSIGSWPQLSSSVTLGGAITTDVVRKILLGRPVKSGRFYVDLDQIIKEEDLDHQFWERPAELTRSDMEQILANMEVQTELELDEELAREAVRQAAMAPSSGNDQPWFFFLHKGGLALFHNLHRSYSFGDFQNLASYQSIGAAIENLFLFLQTKGIDTEVNYFPVKAQRDLVALLSFKESQSPDPGLNDLVKAIPERTTNRIVESRQEIPREILEELSSSVRQFDGTEIKWITDPEDLREQGEIIAGCDKQRVFNPWGHADFFHREMRWTPQEAEEKADGIDIRTLEIDPQNMAALRILSQYDVVKTLESIDGGDALNNISVESANTASAFGLITRPRFDSEEFLIGGRAWERLWLQATHLNWSIHPLIAPLYLFPRILHGGEKELSEKAVKKLWQLRDRFARLWDLPVKTDQAEVFLFKIFKTDHKPTRSIRLNTDQIFFK